MPEQLVLQFGTEEHTGAMPPPAHTPAPAAHRAPPAPPSLPGDFQDAAAAIERRLADVEQYQVPQLAQCRGPLSFHNELATAIRHELAKARRDLDELKVEADDLDRAKERVAASHLIASIQQRIDSCTKAYRQAVVASKRQIDASAHLVAREELFASTSGRASPAPSGSGPGRGRSPMPGQSADDALMQATSDVTEGLRRTLQLMQQEVDRSMTSNELLESQTQTMQLTSNQYSTLSSLMNTSKTLITTLERSNILDRLVLFGAFAFFAAVCAHIFKKRVIDRGVHVVGALGGLVARGGNAVAGVARRGGSVEQASEEATQVVKQGVADEWARATAVAAGAAGALRAGIDMARSKGTQALHERSAPTQTPPQYRSGSQEAPRDAEADVFEELLPQQDEPAVAAPVAAREVTDDAGEPLHVVDEDMSLDEPIPAAASTDEAFKPAVVEPLDDEFEDFADEDAFGYGTAAGEIEAAVDLTVMDELVEEAREHALSSSSSDEDRTPLDSDHPVDTDHEPDLPLAHEAGTVALRQPHPPTPSLPEIPDLAFETPNAAEMPVQKPDLEEAVEAAEYETGAEAAARSANEVVPEASDDLAQAHSDGLAEEGEDTDEESEAEVDAVPPYDLADQLAAASAASSSPDMSARHHLADLPVDYSDLDIEAAPSRTVPVQSGESEPELVADFAELSTEEDLPRDVAGVDRTTIPLDVSDLEDAPPALDVEETGEVPIAISASEEEQSVELPVDFASEQTLWTEENREGGSTSDQDDFEEEPISADESYEPLGQADEALLEELLERQMGGVAGGAYLSPSPSFNETEDRQGHGEAEVLPTDDGPSADSAVTRSNDLVEEPSSNETPEASTEPPLAPPESVADEAELAGIPAPSEAVESSLATTTLEPTPAPAPTQPAAVPEPTLSREPWHDEASKQEVSASVDMAATATAERGQPEPAEPAAEEPASSAPTPTETAHVSTAATSVVAVESGILEQAPTSDAGKPSPAPAHAPPTEPDLAASLPDEDTLDLDSASAQPAAAAATARQAPIPDHPVVANPKLSAGPGAAEHALHVPESNPSEDIDAGPEIPTPPESSEPDSDSADPVPAAEASSPVASAAHVFRDPLAAGDVVDDNVYTEPPASETEEETSDIRDESDENSPEPADDDGEYDAKEEEEAEVEVDAGLDDESLGALATLDDDEAPLHVEL
ncbi:hypothetical protein JCM3774_003073 [Rhodotorula dairenensis]